MAAFAVLVSRGGTGGVVKSASFTEECVASCVTS
jgi:hypothetical protein